MLGLCKYNIRSIMYWYGRSFWGPQSVPKRMDGPDIGHIVKFETMACGVSFLGNFGFLISKMTIFLIYAYSLTINRSLGPISGTDTGHNGQI